MKYELTVNGTGHTIEADPDTPLVFVLRNQLGLTGTKLGCGLEQCGACTVLADGEAVLSCTKAVSEFTGTEIVTIEGLSATPMGAAVQKAFVAENAAQCGYCTPGMVSAATALLERTAKPTRAQVIAALNDLLCRCGSHTRILKAIDRVIADGAHAER